MFRTPLLFDIKKRFWVQKIMKPYSPKLEGPEGGINYVMPKTTNLLKIKFISFE